MISVFDSKGKCSGCSACASICPKGAIKMRADKEGFLYPEIIKENCIDCGICQKICPIINVKTPQGEVSGAYAVQSLDKDKLAKSASGGIASILAEHFLENGDYVCGCVFDKDFYVKHIVTNDIKDLDAIRQSKYVQSDVSEVFPKIKELLDNGKRVLFVGVGCQANGLLSHLKKPYDNLWTLDMICFGGPSPKAWQKYLEENKLKGKITSVCFRDKDIGWGSNFSLTYQDGKKQFIERDKNDYCKAFDKGLIVRPSCYECAFKGATRNTDFTCADLWGHNDIDPTLENVNKGYSLFLTHTDKGEQLFDAVKGKVFYKDIDKEKALNGNPMSTKSCVKAQNRDAFMADIDKFSLKKLNKKYYPKKPLMFRIKVKISKLINKNK